MALKIYAVLDIYLLSESSTFLHRSNDKYEASDVKPCAVAGDIIVPHNESPAIL